MTSSRKLADCGVIAKGNRALHSSCERAGKLGSGCLRALFISRRRTL